MNLDVLRAQLLDIEEKIESLIEADKKKIETEANKQIVMAKRDRCASVNITQEEYKEFSEALRNYIGTFSHTHNITQGFFLRILLRNFMDNWQNLPMEKAWATENALSLERKSYSSTGKYKRRGFLK